MKGGYAYYIRRGGRTKRRWVWWTMEQRPSIIAQEAPIPVERREGQSSVWEWFLRFIRRCLGRNG